VVPGSAVTVSAASVEALLATATWARASSKVSPDRSRSGGDGLAAGVPEKEAGLNQPVRDGKFEFTVTKVDCTKRTIGSNQFSRATASGIFCVVTAKVENIGNEAQYFDDSSQFLFDQQDRKHSVDNEAWAGLETNAFLEEINPGNTVTGTLVFDVPKGTKPSKLELHDSPFSGGVEVQL
jgi:hypothetical protein